MASALKHKLDKVLHRGEYSDDHAAKESSPTHNGAAPSPAIARTSEDKRHGRKTSSGFRDLVRSASKHASLPNIPLLHSILVLVKSLHKFRLSGIADSASPRLHFLDNTDQAHHQVDQEAVPQVVAAMQSIEHPIVHPSSISNSLQLYHKEQHQPCGG